MIDENLLVARLAYLRGEQAALLERAQINLGRLLECEELLRALRSELVVSPDVQSINLEAIDIG